MHSDGCRIERLEARQLLCATPAALLGGVGAIGDSYTDEYRFYSPDRSTARNYVELLAQERHFKFGKYTTADRGDPRHQGYARNWGHDAARSAGAVADQLPGLAQQVATGDVDLALVFIGGNDFRDVFLNLDPATATPESVQAAIGTAVQGVLTNVMTIVGTLQAADPDVKLIVATLPNVAMLPEIRFAVGAGYLPEVLVGAVDAGIDFVNQQVGALAASSDHIGLADVDGLMNAMFSGEAFKVAGVAIDRDLPANDPTHLFLADGIHAGAVGQALLANVFIDAINEEFGTHLRPLAERQILREAGVPKQSLPWAGPAAHRRALLAGAADLLVARCEGVAGLFN